MIPQNTVYSPGHVALIQQNILLKNSEKWAMPAIYPELKGLRDTVPFYFFNLMVTHQPGYRCFQSKVVENYESIRIRS